MKIKNILLAASVFIYATASAQLFPNQNAKEDLISKLPFEKKLLVAKDLYKAGSFFNAEKYFAELKQAQPRNPYITFFLAECFEKNRDYPPAAKYFREAYELAPIFYPEAPYREALMLKSNGQYEEAKERLQFFIKNYKGKNRKIKVYAQRQIEGCDLAIQSLANPDPVFVKNAGPNVNTAYTESSPMPISDTALAFATMNANKFIDKRSDNRKDYVSRLMWSLKEYDRTNVKDSFEVALPFSDGKFNNDKFHVANGVFSPGRDRFYFTRCREKIVEANVGSQLDTFTMHCEIWAAAFDTARGRWGTPEAVKELNIDNGGGAGITECSNTTPFIAVIGKKEVIFFASNRKGQSSGGYDIMYSVYDNKGGTQKGTYRRPQNCGKRVNTNRDEITPFYDSKKGRLYWASNGLVSMGGFDVFSADGGPSRYTNVKNMGAPYNSPADDMYYVEDPGEKGNAYIVSNRLGTTYIKNPTCCDDIWRVIKNPNLSVSGRVLDAKSNEPIQKVVVKLIDESTGNVVDTFYSSNGNYRFNTPMGKNYLITADYLGYTSGRGATSTVGVTAADVDRNDQVDIMLGKITQSYNFHVQNVFYDFNKDDFQAASTKSLDTLATFLKDNPSLIVEVYANTDGIGTDPKNKDLSQRRADKVVAYLQSQGIERSRMIARPQGADVKARPNEKTAEGADDPENRALNRRTYFRIIGDLENKRIIYDDNRPEYIDKTGADKRNKDLQVQENEEADQGAIPNEATPKK
jgi:OmpA-OmpF porin, OOP family